jgi:hypothetical protein
MPAEAPTPNEYKDKPWERVQWETLTPTEQKAIVGSYLGGLLGPGVAVPALGKATWKLGQVPKLTELQEKRLRKAMHAKSIEKRVDDVLGPRGNAFATVVRKRLPSGKIKAVPTVVSGEPLGAGILAHEFGHLTGPWRKIFHKMRYALPATSIAALIGAPYVGGKLANPDESVGRSALKGGLAGAGIGLAGGAPLWLEEGRASLRALKGLRKAKLPTKTLLRSLLGLGSAMGTYTAPGLLLGAGTGIIGSLLRRARERAKRKQEEWL